MLRLYNQIKKDEERTYYQRDYESETKKEIEHYYVYLRQEEVEFDKKRKFTDLERDQRIRSARSLGFWCFNPGLGFKKIIDLKPRTVILTSGTLSPMDSF